jgi:anti-anti-sigma regulatory factor
VNRHVVRLPAELTDDFVEETAGPLRELARRLSLDELMLDATDVVDVSARGLGLLVALDRIARSRGASVVVVDVAESLVPLFAAARLDHSVRGWCCSP